MVEKHLQELTVTSVAFLGLEESGVFFSLGLSASDQKTDIEDLIRRLYLCLRIYPSHPAVL